MPCKINGLFTYITPVIDKDALKARNNERFLDIRFIKNAFSEPDELAITVGKVRAAYNDNKILVNDSQNYQISRFFDNKNVLDDEIINIYLYGENFWKGEITDKNNDDYWAEPLIYIELFQPEKVKVKTIVPGKDPPLQDYMITRLSSVPSSHIHYDNIHASYYKERGLYVGVEPVTDDILEWGKKRIKLENTVLFGKHVKETYKIEDVGNNVNISEITAEDFIFQYADKQMIPDNQLSDTLKELAEKYAPKFASADDYYGYIDAWNAFVYNLQNPYGQAWIAYVSDAPIIGSLSDLPPDSEEVLPSHN